MDENTKREKIRMLKNSEVQHRFGMAHLHDQIRSLRGSIENSMINRRDHPSYGYTKTHIRHDLMRLEGLVAAWLIMRGAREYTTQVINDTGSADIGMLLGFDLADLKRRVKEMN